MKYPAQSAAASMSCGQETNLPRVLDGDISVIYLWIHQHRYTFTSYYGNTAYTATGLKNRPIPAPLTARPTKNIANLTLAASNDAPMAKTSVPMAIAFARPTLLAR